MNRVLIDPNIVSGIADAVRAKKGTTAQIVVSDLPSEIESIEGLPSSTKALANVVSGVTPTDEITLNNALAVGLTDTPETATFTERTTADGGTIKDTIARIDKVKGNCVKFNQLLNPSTYPTSRTVQGVTYKGNGDGSITITGTATATSAVAGISGNFTLLSGHKYIFGAYGCYNTARVRLFGVTMGNKNLVNNLDYAVVDGNGTDYNLAFIYTSGVTYNVTLIPFVIDLTAIGREDITTGDGLAQLYGFANLASMPYLGYQSETIVLTNSQNSVTSKSRNLLASANDLLNASGWEKNTNGEYFGLIQYLKTYTDLDGGIFRNYIGDGTKVLTFSGKYKCSTNIVLYVGFWYSDGTRSSTRYDATEGTFAVTSESGKTITGIRFSFGNSGILTLSDLQIEVGSTATDFCPYFAPDNLPTNARNLTDSEGSTIFPNGMQSNGSTYDEWDMAKGKVVKRIANDGTILATPLTYNVPPQKAYYKVSQNGKEIANSTELSAPFKADIAYRGMSAEDLINELNG